MLSTLLIEFLRKVKTFNIFGFGLKDIDRKDYLQMINKFEDGEQIMTYDCSYFNRTIEIAYLFEFTKKGWFISEIANTLMKRIKIIGENNSVNVERVSYDKSMLWKHYIILMKVTIEKNVSKKDFENFIEEIFDVSYYQKDLKRYLKFVNSYSNEEKII